MNNYTEFNSKSFLIILFLICAVFLGLIIKAFSYIPETSSNQIVQRGASVSKPERTIVNQNTENPLYHDAVYSWNGNGCTDHGTGKSARRRTQRLQL